ncbi:ABC transporter permease [Cellulomonas sp.]|uniref:ABC transporter permease n=1 Tax=Cellulomonas sp. TaxID=40001 RepID=UPI00258FFFAE|nr:ABC transporter permease [Cellulomonas sp.]MCR6687950.1 FtsX-like permease family protein [Cellulomonas sp.]
MSWVARVVLHRARAQSTLLLAVLAVTLVATTLLGVFTLLLVTSQERALQVALDRSPAAATQVEVRIETAVGEPTAATAAADAWLTDLLAPAPATIAHWTTSPWLAVEGTDDPVAPLVYLADYPVVPDRTTLLAGAWPQAVREGDDVLVAVPQASAERYGWGVGTRLPAAGLTTPARLDLRVVGVYRAQPPRSEWARDLLAGRGHAPDVPYPGTFGSVTADGWGPLVVAGFTDDDGATLPVAVARSVASPDLSTADAADVAALQARLPSAEQDLDAALADTGAETTLVTGLDRTLTSLRGDLAITRVGVLVVWLLLLVVAVTVLLLAARLLADRRTAEQTLLTSRGASHGQLVGLAALEAAGVALVTAAVAPWLARVAYLGVTAVPVLRDAGLRVDPGLPPTLWVTCAVAAAALAGVLLAPLARRRVSAVETAQQDVRQDRRQGLARSGADLALVAVAGVALWQLVGHRSPVLRDGTAGVDPLLVAAPALVLLAGGVLAGRVLPLVSGAGELVARRSRALVAPLAAWEVSRRPRRAAGAVLLVTLAVAVGTFAQGWLETWRTSQREQATLAVGTDLRVTDPDGTTLAQSAALAGVDGLQVVSPVTLRQAGVGIASATPGPPSTPETTQVLAVDTRHAGDLLRGRVAGGWTTPTAGLAPAQPVTGIPVPAGTQQLQVDLRVRLQEKAPVVAIPSLVLQDARGTRTTHDFPAAPAKNGAGEVTSLTLDLPPGLGSTTVIGVSTRLSGDADKLLALVDAGLGTHGFEITWSGMRAVGEDGTTTPLDPGRAAWRTGTSGPSGEWGGVRIGSTWADQDGLHVTGSVDGPTIATGTAGTVTTSFQREDAIHVIVTPGVLDSLVADADDALVLEVEGVTVQVRVDAVVPYLPGLPHGDGVLVDRDTLTRATLVLGYRGDLVDEWWARVPDERAPASASAVQAAGVGAVTTRVGAAADATDGPLRVGIPAALWIVTLAATALAVAGIAMSATVAVRTRRLEMARLQALGARRLALVRAVAAEHAVLGVLGTAAGLGVGALLARVVAPVVTVAADGTPAVPDVVVQWPWVTFAVVVGGIAVAATLAVLVTANALLRRASGELLRLGDEG